MSPSNGPDDRSSHHRDLEESFFGKPRAELRERLRKAERTRTRQMETLAEVSGIEDVEVLEKLVLLGIRSETLAALTLYPLVAVAWADGKVDRHEREAVLRGARECSVAPGSVSYDLLAGWLEERPDAVLLRAWQGLVRELAGQVDAEWRLVFARELLARAHAVAEASGGFLALEKTSADEQTVLDRLRDAFQQDGR
jgi:tellurite resistance protein